MLGVIFTTFAPVATEFPDIMFTDAIAGTDPNIIKLVAKAAIAIVLFIFILLTTFTCPTVGAFFTALNPSHRC